MNRSHYITPQEYEQAAANGISYSCLTKRIRYYNWDRQTALTKPAQRDSHINYSKIAQANGIKYATFQKRVVRYNWSPERAATTPPQDKYELLLAGREMRRKASEEIHSIREANGIPYSTFMQRIRKGMDINKAATQRRARL